MSDWKSRRTAAGHALAGVRDYNACMQRPTGLYVIDRHPLRLRSDRFVLRTAGILAALVGAVMGWQNGDRVFQAILDLWLHTVLPAFHALHISGLPFCS